MDTISLWAATLNMILRRNEEIFGSWDCWACTGTVARGRKNNMHINSCSNIATSHLAVGQWAVPYSMLLFLTSFLAYHRFTLSYLFVTFAPGIGVIFMTNFEVWHFSFLPIRKIFPGIRVVVAWRPHKRNREVTKMTKMSQLNVKFPINKQIHVTVC